MELYALKVNHLDRPLGHFLPRTVLSGRLTVSASRRRA